MLWCSDTPTLTVISEKHKYHIHVSMIPILYWTITVNEIMYIVKEVWFNFSKSMQQINTHGLLVNWSQDVKMQVDTKVVLNNSMKYTVPWPIDWFKVWILLFPPLLSTIPPVLNLDGKVCTC